MIKNMRILDYFQIQKQINSSISNNYKIKTNQRIIFPSIPILYRQKSIPFDLLMFFVANKKRNIITLSNKIKFLSRKKQFRELNLNPTNKTKMMSKDKENENSQVVVETISLPSSQSSTDIEVINSINNKGAQESRIVLGKSELDQFSCSIQNSIQFMFQFSQTFAENKFHISNIAKFIPTISQKINYQNYLDSVFELELELNKVSSITMESKSYGQSISSTLQKAVEEILYDKSCQNGQQFFQNENIKVSLKVIEKNIQKMQSDISSQIDKISQISLLKEVNSVKLHLRQLYGFHNSEEAKQTILNQIQNCKQMEEDIKVEIIQKDKLLLQLKNYQQEINQMNEILNDYQQRQQDNKQEIMKIQLHQNSFRQQNKDISQMKKRLNTFRNQKKQLNNDILRAQQNRNQEQYQLLLPRKKDLSTQIDLLYNTMREMEHEISLAQTSDSTTNKDSYSQQVSEGKQLKFEIQKIETQKKTILFRISKIEASLFKIEASIATQKHMLEMNQRLYRPDLKQEQAAQSELKLDQALLQFGFISKMSLDEFWESLETPIHIQLKVINYLYELQGYLQNSWEALCNAQRRINIFNELKRQPPVRLSNTAIKEQLKQQLNIQSSLFDQNSFASELLRLIDSELEGQIRSSTINYQFFQDKVFPQIMMSLNVLQMLRISDNRQCNSSYKNEESNNFDDNDDNQLFIDEYIEQLFVQTVGQPDCFSEIQENLSFIKNQVKVKKLELKSSMDQESKKIIQQEISDYEKDLLQQKQKLIKSNKEFRKLHSNFLDSLNRVVLILKETVEIVVGKFQENKTDRPLHNFLQQCQNNTEAIDQIQKISISSKKD